MYALSKRKVMEALTALELQIPRVDRAALLIVSMCLVYHTLIRIVVIVIEKE